MFLPWQNLPAPQGQLAHGKVSVDVGDVQNASTVTTCDKLTPVPVAVCYCPVRWYLLQAVLPAQRYVFLSGGSLSIAAGPTDSKWE